jgi:hypothetical protein
LTWFDIHSGETEIKYAWIIKAKLTEAEIRHIASNHNLVREESQTFTTDVVIYFRMKVFLQQKEFRSNSRPVAEKVREIVVSQKPSIGVHR